MSIQTEISRISTNVSNALNAIAQRGVTIPGGSGSGDLSRLIASIPEGIILPEAMHRVEFFTITVPEATDRVQTSYDIVMGESWTTQNQFNTIQNKHVPNIVIGWTDATVANNQVIRFIKFENFFAPTFISDTIYVQGYGHYVSTGRSIVASNEMEHDYISIRFNNTKHQNIITKTTPSTAFNFAPNVPYNIMLFRWKDAANT